MTLLVSVRFRGGPQLIMERFVAGTVPGPAELDCWSHCAQEMVRRGLLREGDGGGLWDPYDIVLEAQEPLIAICYNHRLLDAISRARSHSWGARVFLAVPAVLPTDPESVKAVSRWLAAAQGKGVHGIIGLHGIGVAAQLEIGLDQAHERILVLKDMLAQDGGSWRASAARRGLRGALFRSLGVGQLLEVDADRGVAAIVEHDGGRRHEVGPEHDVICNWDVEVYDFLRRLTKRDGSTRAADRGTLLLTGGFKPHEKNCLYSAHEMARLEALVPAGVAIVCPALPQGRLYHVMARHPSISAWVHASHGNGAVVTCADGGELNADSLQDAIGKAPALKLIALSACNSVELAEELAKRGVLSRSRVRYMVAYPDALLPEVAYHVSTHVVSAYFDLRGDSTTAIRAAFENGERDQRGARGNHEPVLFIDGKRA